MTTDDSPQPTCAPKSRALQCLAAASVKPLTTDGTVSGMVMTRPRSVNSRCTRTTMSATSIAVNSPCEPSPGVRNVRSDGSIWISRKIVAAIVALTSASSPKRVPRS